MRDKRMRCLRLKQPNKRMRCFGLMRDKRMGCTWVDPR